MEKIAGKFTRGLYTPRSMQLGNSSLLEFVDVDVGTKVSPGCPVFANSLFHRNGHTIK